MAATIKYVTAHIIFQVIKVLYNDYNYYKLIINYIIQLFMKLIRIDIYSACQSKHRSYSNMSVFILNTNSKVETIENIHY